MARLTGEAGETSGNVAGPRLDSGKDRGFHGLRTMCVHLGLPDNTVKLRKQGPMLEIIMTSTTEKQN
ncbi:unnamed protein product [Protopolystoma xenopodis]|uniref:Uncharacterized protein n=1 Tax=Protopolystoma xenopodis TaxID=117903 RepID=A0A3S5AAU2_9PLAT|nr:unnamed protein product [Protopolystoma xenopodis]